MKPKFLILIVLALGTISCKSEKDKYLDSYETFVDQIVEQCDTFTATDWEAYEKKYTELRDKYSLYVTDMTLEERQRIDSLNSKVNAKLIEYKAKDVMQSVGGTVKEIIGTMEELLNDVISPEKEE